MSSDAPGIRRLATLTVALVVVVPGLGALHAAALRLDADPAAPTDAPSAPSGTRLAEELAETPIPGEAARVGSLSIRRLDLGADCLRIGSQGPAVGCDDADGSSHPRAKTDGPSVAMTTSASMETPQWYAAVAPIDGLDGSAHVRVHGFGEVAVMTDDGRFVWRRPSMTFYDDWPVDNNDPPVVPIGADPLDPLTLASDAAYAVGDLTGDGVDDVAVAHLVVRGAYAREPPASTITVLDGTDGSTVWASRYDPVVNQVRIAGDRLIVGQQDVLGDATPTRLLAFRFTSTGGDVEVRSAWTHPVPADGPGRWTATARLGDGRLAAAWTDDGLGGSGPVARLLVLDAATGETIWSRQTSYYPRDLAWDARRGAVVAHLQRDWERGRTDTFGYRAVAFDADTGEPTTRLDRPDAVLLDLDVGEATSDAGAEWILGDVRTTDRPATDVEAVEAGRVTAYSPAAGTIRWTHRDPGALLPFGVVAAPEGVAVGAIDARSGSADNVLRVLSGADGRLRWRVGDAPVPLFLASAKVRGRPAVIGAHPDLAARGYAFQDGTRLLDRPVPHEIQAVAAHDVDGDGLDELIVGGKGRTVSAVEPGSLGPTPDVHWRARVDSPVHQLELGDLAPAAGPELVAVASEGVHVLDPATGALRYRIPTSTFTWTATVADVDRDGRDDVVVPTRNLSVYQGASGDLLWRYAPKVRAHLSTAAVAEDGTVGVQVFVAPSGPAVSQFQKPLNWVGHVLAFDGVTGERAWRRSLPSDRVPRLWRSVVHHPRLAQTDGNGLAFVTAERIETDGEGLATEALDTRLRTDVYEAASGTRLWGSWATSHFGHNGLRYLDGLVEYNWFGTVRMRPGRAGTQTDYVPDSNWSMFVSDVASARTDDGRSVTLVDSPGTVFAYRDGVSTGDDATTPLGVWNGSRVLPGSIVVAEFDGDAGDEVAAIPFDWSTWSRVTGWRGVGTVGSFRSVQGVAVADVGDATPRSLTGKGPVTPGPGALAAVVAAGAAAALLRRRKGSTKA